MAKVRVLEKGAALFATIRSLINNAFKQCEPRDGRFQ